MEKTKDFNGELHELILKTIKEHKRIIFNGNGYDDSWVKEAEKRGLTATKEEIAQFLAGQKRAYEESTEVKASLDEYCAGAGMTIEEYWALLEQYAPETVTRQKLKGEILESYRAEHPDASEEDVSAAWNAYEQALLDQHRSEIVWTGK